MTNTTTKRIALQNYEHEHDCPFEAFITNLGKYNEGELIGEWVKFPCDSEELEQVFERIGINEYYEEFFITDYDCYVPGLYDKLGEYESIETLNELAETIESLDSWEYDTLCAVLEAQSFESLEDIITEAQDLNNYTLIDAHDNYDLGYYFAIECDCLNIPDSIVNYFDFEAYGRDISFDGTFTEKGFLMNCQKV